MTDRFQALMAEASAEDKTELTLAYNAKISTMKAYKDKPGKQTKVNSPACSRWEKPQ